MLKFYSSSIALLIICISQCCHNRVVYWVYTGLIQVKEEGLTGFSEGWQGCSEGFLEGEARGKSCCHNLAILGLKVLGNVGKITFKVFLVNSQCFQVHLKYFELILLYFCLRGFVANLVLSKITHFFGSNFSA